MQCCPHILPHSGHKSLTLPTQQKANLDDRGHWIGDNAFSSEACEAMTLMQHVAVVPPLAHMQAASQTVGRGACSPLKSIQWEKQALHVGEP
eukprot:1679595-Amphidinium_carterae.1